MDKHQYIKSFRLLKTTLCIKNKTLPRSTRIPCPLIELLDISAIGLLTVECRLITWVVNSIYSVRSKPLQNASIRLSKRTNNGLGKRSSCRKLFHIRLTGTLQDTPILQLPHLNLYQRLPFHTCSHQMYLSLTRYHLHILPANPFPGFPIDKLRNKHRTRISRLFHAIRKEENWLRSYS